jgi:asparagine synthase (glutamine-hydrolysing)
MCRIAGILSGNLKIEKALREVQAMCTVMQHGGPDDEGVFISPDASCCLGNRRLSILDLSQSGHQPMTIASRFSITFNGEIYNFKDLRRELQGYGYSFITDSDTEVILIAFQHWGIASFKKLSGMFAFALFDSVNKQTYLVRDASGIKPLYYSKLSEGLIFSSEIKAFKETEYLFENDERWKIYMLAFGYIPEPYTTLKNVFTLEKGHYLLYDHSIDYLKERPFKTFVFSYEISDYRIAMQRVKRSINDAVKSHLIADVPVGVFLSGGIDSSILTLLAYKYSKENINAISIDHEEQEFTERPYRQLINNMIGNRNTEYLVTYDDFADNFDTIMSAMDQPSTDGINTWFASKHAKDHGLKCILSGIGADELFGGYPAFRRMALLERLRVIPKKILRMSENLFNVNYKRLYYLSYDNQIGQYLFMRGYYTPTYIAKLLDADVKEVDGILSGFTVGSWFQPLTSGNRASWNAINIYMQNQLLKDTDSMSMSHGLEVRIPFLDQQLIELVLSIHPSAKFDHALPKKLLIDSFKDTLPEPIWNREKMGFTFPFQEWMKRFERISDPSQYKNETAKELMLQFQSGGLHWSNAFALYHACKI